jgi:hypothetical protein
VSFRYFLRLNRPTESPHARQVRRLRRQRATWAYEDDWSVEVRLTCLIFNMVVNGRTRPSQIALRSFVCTCEGGGKKQYRMRFCDPRYDLDS